MVTTFNVDLEPAAVISICLPYAMLEPIRDLLDAGVQSDRGERDERWELAMREEVMGASVEISSVFGEATLPLRVLAGLQVGDIIPMDVKDEVEVCAESLPIFRGRVGVHKQQLRDKDFQLDRAQQFAAVARTDLDIEERKGTELVPGKGMTRRIRNERRSEKRRPKHWPTSGSGAGRAGPRQGWRGRRGGAFPGTAARRARHGCR